MYSTIASASFSKAFANKAVTVMMSVKKNKPLPYYVDIAVTGKCNCNCSHCSFIDKKTKEKELSFEEMRKLIQESLDLGVSSISFVGGEPLMRPDLPNLIKLVNPDLAVTSIFTNGWFLKEKALELKKAGLTSVKISIDSPFEKKHDEMRKMPGLFRRAIAGIKEANKLGLITSISCCITQKDIDSGDFERLILLAKNLNVKELFVFDAIPVGNYKHRTDLFEEGPIYISLKKIADKYNFNKKYQDYPAIFLYSYLKSPASLGCSGGVTYFYVDPYGKVFPCDFHNISYGNIKDRPLSVIWDEMAKKRGCSSNGCDMKRFSELNCPKKDNKKHL
jgi:radical SAM protein with 4Fe4S-binding SPASM domain